LAPHHAAWLRLFAARADQDDLHASLRLSARNTGARAHAGYGQVSARLGFVYPGSPVVWEQSCGPRPAR
jgi:hypothetical protein